MVLLGVLAEQPRHGYAIINALKVQTGGVLDLQEGSVYPALHRLEDLGWVASEWQPINGRRRREYHLTPAGAKALAAERREWTRLVEAIDAVLAVRSAATNRRLAGGPA
jgi:PadR family transcriptional regulator, regulatory protein PadR